MIRSPVEIERFNRIKVSVYAYAYEIQAVSLVPDFQFDMLAKVIQPKMATGNCQVDAFFFLFFTPDTGQWIYQHPEMGKLEALYWKHYAPR